MAGRFVGAGVSNHGVQCAARLSEPSRVGAGSVLQQLPLCRRLRAFAVVAPLVRQPVVGRVR
jgi:hypothetical protein